MGWKMMPASHPILPLISVNSEPSIAPNMKHFESHKPPNNQELNGKKLCSFKVTFPDKICLERSSKETKTHKTKLSNLFSQLDNDRSIKGPKRKNLFGSKLDDNSSLDTSNYSKEANCAVFEKKFKRFHNQIDIDDKKHHNSLSSLIEYFGKFNRHSITSSLVQKFDTKFKEIAFVEDMIQNPSISNSFAVSTKHNSKISFHRSKNFHLNRSQTTKSSNTDNNANSLNLFEDNCEIVNSILPELNTLMTKNTRLDECQNLFDSIDMDKLLSSTDVNKKPEIQPDKLCPQIEIDIRYQHYILKITNLILNSLQKIYNLNLQQIKYLLSSYQSRLMAKNLCSKNELILRHECTALEKKLNNLIEEYAKFNFDSVSERPNLLNLGSIIYRYLLNQLNQYMTKNELKHNFNYIKEIIDYYEIIKIEYKKFCIFDLNYQLGSSITEHQKSGLMTYLNDFKIFLKDILSEFLLAGKLDSLPKINEILQIETALIANDCIQVEQLTDPRSRTLKPCTEFKKLKFAFDKNVVPIPSYNQKIYKKHKYKYKAEYDHIDIGMWSSVRKNIELEEVADFEDTSELSFDGHDMGHLLDTNLVVNDTKMDLNAPLVDSPRHFVPKTPVFKPNFSDSNDGFSFLEPSIHNFEDIQSVPITPVLNSSIEFLITKNFAKDADQNELLNGNSDFDLMEEISQFVIRPLMDNIEKMFVINSKF